MDILNEQLSSDTAITYSFRPHVLGQTLIDAQIPIIVHAQSYTHAQHDSPTGLATLQTRRPLVAAFPKPRLAALR